MSDVNEQIGWKKGIYPSDDFLMKSLDKGELFILKENDILRACVVLNSNYNMGYEKVGLWGISKGAELAAKQIMERLQEHEYETLIYEHGTHFVLPESMLRIALPIGVKFVLKFVFRAAKEYPDECEAARKDIDKKVSAALKEWIQ